MVVAEKPSKEVQELAERIDADIAAFKARVLARPNASEFLLQEIYSDIFQVGALNTPFGFVDGGGNTVVGWTLNNPLEIGTQSALYAAYLAPDGSVMAEGIGTPADQTKVDGSTSWQTGVRGAALATAHALQPPPRKNGAYMAPLPFTLVPYGPGEVPLAREGGFTGSEGGGEVDPVVLREAVREVMGVPEGMTFFQVLTQAIAGSPSGSIRQGLEDKDKDALAELFNDPPRSEIERVFQERFFQFVKNANAGVQENIINGQDEWGQAQHSAFVRMVREALAPHAVVEGTESVDGGSRVPYTPPE